MINCPYCNKPAELEKIYKLMLCKNKDCSFFLKDDVRLAQVGAPSSKAQVAPSNPNGRKFHSLIDLVDDIMDNFDFDKTQEVMRYLNWGWASCNGNVPTITDLRAFARHNLEKTILNGRSTQKEAQYITGGFEIRYFYDDDFVEIKFVLTDWETCLPELN